ncbi:hypothetical protein [Nannocystis pusilla]|uniref:hypothetical protein n=1 Tax=Nannocystis pusilla TaxID=889268 RepID=UPI003B79348B
MQEHPARDGSPTRAQRCEQGLEGGLCAAAVTADTQQQSAPHHERGQRHPEAQPRQDLPLGQSLVAGDELLKLLGVASEAALGSGSGGNALGLQALLSLLRAPRGLALLVPTHMHAIELQRRQEGQPQRQQQQEGEDPESDRRHEARVRKRG